jgi:hypothetical protein
MKYILIPFIALGLTLGMVYGVVYECEGSEPFPTYYGSPFIFKQSSLGSSMEYFFNITGILLNMLVWSVLLFILRFGYQVVLELARYNVYLRISYYVVVSSLVVFTLLNLFMMSIDMGGDFDPDMNYWYWNVDKDMKDYGMECRGTLGFFR